MESPKNIFIDLVKLDDIRAEGIVRKLLDSLEKANLNEAFLSKTLISLTCAQSDSKPLFPNIMVG